MPSVHRTLSLARLSFTLLLRARVWRSLPVNRGCFGATPGLQLGASGAGQGGVLLGPGCLKITVVVDIHIYICTINNSRLFRFGFLEF